MSWSFPGVNPKCLNHIRMLLNQIQYEPQRFKYISNHSEYPFSAASPFPELAFVSFEFRAHVCVCVWRVL